MGINYKKTLFKLQLAINKRPGVKILVSTSQWYSDIEDKPVTVYHIRARTVDEETKKSTASEIFRTYSLIQAILFLRDFWYELNGWELPTDNERWNELREQWQKNKGAPLSEHQNMTNEELITKPVYR